MKRHHRSKPRFARALLTTTLPAAGLSLLTFVGGGAYAQEINSAANSTDRTGQSVPSTDLPEIAAPEITTREAADPQAGLVIGEIIITGNKTLSSAAIIAMSGHKVGDPCNDQTITEIRQRLAQSGNFGMHYPGEPEKWIQVVRK